MNLNKLMVDSMDKEMIKQYRVFLKDSIRKITDFSQTDQNRGVAPPPIAKPYPKEGKRLVLPPFELFNEIGNLDLKVGDQKSRKPPFLQQQPNHS